MPRDLEGKVTGSFFWTLCQQGSSKLAGLVIEVLLARLLAPDAFGVLAILTVFVNIADGMSRSGLNLALVQRQKARERDFNTGFWLNEAISGSLYLLVFCAAPLIAGFYGMSDLSLFLRVFALVLFTNAYNSIQRAYLQKNFEFRGVFLASLAAVVLSGVLGIIAAMLGVGTWALVLQSMSNSVISCIIYSIVVPWRPRFEYDASVAKDLFRFGWKSSASSILNNIYSGASSLIIGRVASEHDLGLYNRVTRYPRALVAIITGAAADVLLPTFSVLQDRRDALKENARKALVTGSFFSVPLSFLLTTIAGPAVSLLLGDAWVDCVPVFRLTSISLSVIFLQTVNQRVCLAAGRSDMYFAQEAGKIALLSLLVIGTALVSHDINAVAAANCLGLIVCVVMFDMRSAAQLLGYRRVEQLGDLSKCFGSSFLSAAVAALSSWLPFPAVVALACETILFVTVYVLSSICMKDAAIGHISKVLNSLAEKKNGAGRS